jgi:hypothetical protein
VENLHVFLFLQLTLCRRAREMAVELQEAPITFAPTYRMLVGTEKYDIA